MQVSGPLLRTTPLELLPDLWPTCRTHHSPLLPTRAHHSASAFACGGVRFGPTVSPMTTTTLACMTCGYQVAPSAKRCPSCNEKRPAPTIENGIKALLGAAVLVVVLIAVVVGGHGGGGTDKVVAQLVKQDGACLAAASVSTDGATVQDGVQDGWHFVVLSDGANFSVDPRGHVYDENSIADGDMGSGGC